MSRLPFDPEKMKAAEAAARAEPGPKASDGAPSTSRPLSVSQLATEIDLALKDNLPAKVLVRGEISGFKNQNHWYFSLKDEAAVISCVMFASSARKQTFTPKDGDDVLATGRVEFWQRGGRTQLYIEKLEPIGAGALEAKFRALCEALRALEYFDPARKKALPLFPRRIAIVTSRNAAALQDVLDTARRRCPGIELSLVDVRVQGEAAAPQVARAIAWLSNNASKLSIDAILVTRGGGSIEDLWAFNERVVADAIFNCTIPVVAAIGHETDTTVAELVADERCATPTQAAMRLIPDRMALLEQLDHLGARLHGRVDRTLVGERRHIRTLRSRLTQGGAHYLSRQSVRLERLAARLAKHRPDAIYARRRVRLDRASDRLASAIGARLAATPHESLFDMLTDSLARSLERAHARISALDRELEVVSPMAVLARGYSMTLRADGSALRRAGDATPGDTLTTRLSAGTVTSRVESAGDGPAAPRQAAPALPKREQLQSARKGALRRRSRKADDPTQMDLF
ncbi:MAG: exodeoxyribonuclease VII large subunit [Phycisphaerales bacterium]|nr:exodeoxyribonuclease VII large subunit [Phycisphaerales bacterium]